MALIQKKLRFYRCNPTLLACTAYGIQVSKNGLEISYKLTHKSNRKVLNSETFEVQQEQ